MSEKFNARPEVNKHSLSRAIILALVASIPTLTLSPNEGKADSLTDLKASIEASRENPTDSDGSLTEFAAKLNESTKSSEISRWIATAIQEKYPEMDFSTEEYYLYSVALLKKLEDLNKDGDFNDKGENGFVIVATKAPETIIPGTVVGSVEIKAGSDYFSFEANDTSDIILPGKEITAIDSMSSFAIIDRDIKPSDQQISD